MEMQGLDELLERFQPPIATVMRETAELVAALRPDLEGKVKSGWGSINFRHKRAGFVCAVFPQPDHVSLVFEHGRLLSSPLLVGDTKQVRWIVLKPGDTLPEDEIGILLAEAIALRA
jgi:hypothetical protein